MTIDDMRERFRMLLASARQQENAIDALARRINRCLMLFDDRLYDLASGDFVAVSNLNHNDSNVIAEAAARLLQTSQTDTECVMLLLPPSEFLAGEVNMPGLSREAMRAALQLQAMTQLPEFDQPLNLALAGHEAPGHSPQALVWWIPAARTSALFDAFAGQSLFLAAVLPRPLWLLAGMQTLMQEQAPQEQALVVQDADKDLLTVITSQPGSTDNKHGAALHCLQTTTADLLQPELLAHWQQELVRVGVQKVSHGVASGDDYMRLLRQHNLQHINVHVAASGAYPAAALAARHQLDRGRRRGLLIKAVAAVLALVTLPFLYQSWQISRLEGQLAETRLLSAEAREHQAAVREFETQWGVMTEFPDQNVGDAMLALQDVVNPGVLTMFEIDEGFISIEGQSDDPQNVLEQLEQNPLFTQVDFARATNNNRYFIELRLTTVNFPAYQEWHFPERR